MHRDCVLYFTTKYQFSFKSAINYFARRSARAADRDARRVNGGRDKKKKALLNENGEQLLYKPVGRLGTPAAAPAHLNKTDVSGRPAASLAQRCY